MTKVTLYHIPPSYYSQIARLVLAEKGVPWRSQYVVPGPPIFETYQPWYMRLNPMGTVPTLVDKNKILTETIDIARYLDANFEGPSLIPGNDGERAAMEDWIARMYQISVRELSYGSQTPARPGALVNRWRVRNLKRWEGKHPEMAETYRNKIRDIEEFAANAADSGHMGAMRERLQTTLDEMEATLTGHPMLCGERYTLADAFWTVAVARFHFLDIDPLKDRPALTQWYARVKARPSFEAGDVWESFRFSRMLPILIQKLGPRLALILVGIGALWTLLWWAL